MEGDLLKSNTDCVYFLASPFTCKKGVECEYRHSDMARLNPRDCWYWLSGNCLNPACAFRHPPLDSHNESTTETALPNPSSMATTKTTVPCYFYYNAFCSKGHKCPFLHEPSNTFRSDPKIANGPVIPSDSKSKTPRGVDAGHIPPKNPSPKMDVAPSNSKQGEQITNPSEQIYIPQCEEIATFETKSESEPSLDSDGSSEELIDGNIIRDELESSPGLDVLVDERTEEDLVYEDNPEYLHERGFFDNNDLYDQFENLRDELRMDPLEYPPRQKQVGNASVARKRKFDGLESRVGGGAHHDVDLRDYLRKRRMVDGVFEKHDSGHEYHRYGSTRRAHGRLKSKVERNGVRFSRRQNSTIESEQQGRYKNSQYNSARKFSKRQSRNYLTERSSYSKRERDIHRPTAFSKPKSLAELKEGKRPGLSNGSMDFEGPKPLSEILKVKKKPGSDEAVGN